MEKIKRDKFFSILGKTTLLGTILSFLPTKFLKSLNNTSQKNITIKINPEAIKRNKV